jgi:SAM-dependent methyltransferase
MADRDEVDYWLRRGKFAYEYKGEIFYTITLIPLYVRRRQRLLEYVEPYLRDGSVNKILDFGCGDGWYVDYFGRNFPEKLFFGCDLSETMIERAKLRETGKYAVSKNRIPFKEEFDLIYSFAVLAHIVGQKELEAVYREIWRKLRPGGRFLLFEATGPTRKGRNSARRPENVYIELGEQYGFVLEQKKLILFSLFYFYERWILRYSLEYFLPGENAEQKHIWMNRSEWLNRFHEKLVYLSERPWLSWIKSSWGNTLFIFTKDEHAT